MGGQGGNAPPNCGSYTNQPFSLKRNPSTVCYNGFYADISNQHQMRQCKSCLKSCLQSFGCFEVPQTPMSQYFRHRHLKEYKYPKKGQIYHFNVAIYASRDVCVKDIGSQASMVLKKLPKSNRNDFKHDLYCCIWRWFEMST